MNTLFLVLIHVPKKMVIYERKAFYDITNHIFIIHLLGKNNTIPSRSIIVDIKENIRRLENNQTTSPWTNNTMKSIISSIVNISVYLLHRTNK